MAIVEMQDSIRDQTLRELPPHLASYLLSQFGLLAERSSPEFIASVLEERRLTGLRYLGYTLSDAEFGVVTIADLTLRLRSLVDDPDPSNVMRSIIHQAARISPSERQQLLQALSHLHEEYGPQAITPKQRVIVDRALMRLLHHMEGTSAFELAARCAASPRGTRRQASYRFYHARGFDDEGRRRVATNFDIDSTHSYRTLITTDAQIVQRIGVWAVLSSAPSVYWRRRAIEHLLDDTDRLDLIAQSYPDEVLWAIRTKERSDLASFVLQLLRKHRDDPYVVNCAILCLRMLDNATSLAEAVQAGRRLLADQKSSDEELP